MKVQIVVRSADGKSLVPNYGCGASSDYHPYVQEPFLHTCQCGRPDMDHSLREFLEHAIAPSVDEMGACHPGWPVKEKAA